MAAVAGNVRFSPDNIAAKWWLGGCSVIPISTDGTKSPAVRKWKPFQTERASAETVQDWFEVQNPQSGVAVICGSVSGNLEMLELEGRAHTPESLDRIKTACQWHNITELWQRLTEQGYTEATPSGGLHLLYRITDHPIPHNTKIASRYATEDEYTAEERGIREGRPTWQATRVLAETRGEGGYVVVAPTGGHCHRTGQPWQTLTGTPGVFLEVSWQEREALHAAIRMALNEIHTDLAISEAPRPPKPQGVPGVVSAADDFDARHSWEEDWFLSQGWRIHHREGTVIYWTRPGKDHADGHSATTGYSATGDRLYLWTTSTDLPNEEPMSKFFVYAHYHFNGDLSTAARTLRSQGYGTPVIVPTDFAPVNFDGEAAEEGDNQEGGDLAPVEEIKSHHLHSLAEQARPNGGLIFTDVGYARRIVDRYSRTLRYNTVEKRWYVWHPGASAWEPDDYATVDLISETSAEAALSTLSNAYDRAIGSGNEKRATMLYKEAQSALSQSRINAAIARFKAQPGISVTPDAFDSNLDLLNLQNGVLNLVTREIMPHDPSQMMMLTFGAAYDPDAKCPRFMHFIEEVLPDKAARDYVQRALGYSLTGRPTERVMFMLHGPSGTGKSVLTSVMTSVFGGYGTTAPATTFRLKKTETTVDLHQLRGKRFVATSEMPEGAQLDEELIKRVTGGDTLTSRALYESFHHWKARCVIWIATNYLPRLSSDDNAIWRRARTIPMRTEFGPHANTEIKGLADLLLQERDGILNWLLDGLNEYQAGKGLSEPPVILTDIESYRTDMDSVASWFREVIGEGTFVIDPTGSVPTQQLYSSYTQQCTDSGIQPLGRLRFTKRLLGMGPALDAVKIGGQRVCTGLRFHGSL